MKGVEALAAAISAGTDRQYTVPGFPVTELGASTKAEMVVNEKTALEYALGDSLSGRRAAVIIKNVGVNACVDPLVQATVQGLRGGVLLVVGDDPGAKGSQTAQDSRYYGELAEIPVIEPDETTCFTGVEAALAASETFSRVAMLRLTPQLLDAEVTGSPVSRKCGKREACRTGLDHVWQGYGRYRGVPVNVCLVGRLAPEPVAERYTWCRTCPGGFPACDCAPGARPCRTVP